MVGEYRVVVKDRKLKYDFIIRRKYTILRGDSSTGKSTLYKMLLENEGVGVFTECSVPVVPVGTISVLSSISKCKGSIIVLDENVINISSKEVAKILNGSDNYFILITRKNIETLPYSINEIYHLSSEKYNNVRRVYTSTTFKSIYSRYRSDFCPDVIVTEDERFGNKFFKEGFPDVIIFPDKGSSVELMQKGGKSTILYKLKYLSRKEYQGKKIFFVVDGSAFGSNITNIESIIRLTDLDITLFAPESFEYLLLKSIGEYKNLIDKPFMYAEAGKFESWERYFTYLLENMYKNDEIKRYSKTGYNSYYLRYKEKVVEILLEEG